MVTKPIKDKAKHIKSFLQSIKIAQIMTTPVVALREDDELSAAEEIFAKNQYFYVPVVDMNRKLVGLVSHKYLYKTQSPRRMGSEEMEYDPNIILEGDSFYERDTLNKYILRYVMQKTPFSMTVDQSVSDAIVEMSRQNLSCIPIVDKDKYVRGILTHREIVNFAAQILRD